MGLAMPPPRAVSKEEFERRREAGAETMKELDPEFSEWLEEADKVIRFRATTLCVCFAIILITMIIVLSR